MKKVTMFHLHECPYCKKAKAFMKELVEENPEYADVEFEMVEETEHPEIIENYNYQAVPCYYIGDDNIFEAYFMIPDAELKEGVKSVYDAALA